MEVGGFGRDDRHAPLPCARRVLSACGSEGSIHESRCTSCLPSGRAPERGAKRVAMGASPGVHGSGQCAPTGVFARTVRVTGEGQGGWWGARGERRPGSRWLGSCGALLHASSSRPMMISKAWWVSSVSRISRVENLTRARARLVRRRSLSEGARVLISLGEYSRSSSTARPPPAPATASLAPPWRRPSASWKAESSPTSRPAMCAIKRSSLRRSALERPRGERGTFSRWQGAGEGCGMR